jgi:hypothetical protein
MIRGLLSHVFIRLQALVRSAAFAGLVGFASVALTAQAPPRQAGAADSFNGRWRLDEKASTGVPPMMRGHETAVHLTQSSNQFTIAFVFDGQAMNTSEFVLDGQTHSGQRGATQQARWTNGFRTIEITIHRPVDGPMPGGTEHLLWELEPGGQTIRRTSTNPETKAPPQVYVYRRMQSPGGARVPQRQ